MIKNKTEIYFLDSRMQLLTDTVEFSRVIVVVVVTIVGQCVEYDNFMWLEVKIWLTENLVVFVFPVDVDFPLYTECIK